jgi:glycosyltransferase involved in cell wall biosynthesis
MMLLKNQDIHLTLVGEGELEGYISAQIKKYNLKISIISPQKYLRLFYLNSDLCISTSLVDPFPTFMLQSGLYGCPFIGSNISGINELIVDEKNGFLFAPNDYKSLAEKIVFLKNNQQLLKYVSENLNAVVKNQFTDINIIPQILNVYKNISRDK